MAIVINTTIGGANSNSYQTIAELDALMETLPHSTGWTRGATGTELENQIRWATYATTLLNSLYWLGSPATETQALAHPRVNLPRKEGVGFGYGFYNTFRNRSPYHRSAYNSDEIALPIKHAQAEIILNLIRDGSTGALAQGGDNGGEFESFKIGSITVNSRQGSARSIQDLILSERVRQLLSGLYQTAFRERM